MIPSLQNNDSSFVNNSQNKANITKDAISNLSESITILP